MKTDIDALAREYSQALYVVAKAEQFGRGCDHDLVDIPHAIISTIRSIFPQLAALSFSRNEQKQRGDVSYGDDCSKKWSYVYPTDAVDYAKTLIRDLFKEGDPHENQHRQNS